MIVRLAREQLPLLTLARNPFSSTASHGHEAHPDPTIVTAHNPDAVDDLRGFEHLDSLTETEKSYSSLHSTTYNYLSAYSFASLLPYDRLDLATPPQNSSVIWPLTRPQPSLPTTFTSPRSTPTEFLSINPQIDWATTSPSINF